MPVPLEGLKVLEVAHWVAAPSAYAIMADMGAEVVKIEHPETGDPVRSVDVSSRGVVQHSGGINSIFELLNRGKQSAAVPETLFAPGNEVPEWFFDGRSKEAADASRLALQSTHPIEWQPGGDKPMLVIQGAYDKVAVPENAEILRRIWPDRVKVEIVENAGHAVLIERPREVAEIIKKYLS